MGVRKLELLSPAKNLEVGTAAIMAGADAVYIGGPSFGARAAAGNSIEDIAKLCAFAHRFGAHVYMTVNTLLYDHELEGVESLIAQARSAGVDALIIQDPAVLTMSSVQDLELHASTQMNIDTLDKVEFCRQLGFGQIVVPREFSLEEIANFTSHYPDLRFEVFVSGAMCVSVSGICYISELMTDRSANRGECAQICRLPMDFYHHDKKDPQSEDQLLASGHLLSMKDNMRLHELEDLVAAGASSFKIEGRLKDRDYVVNQVAAFRERLDKIIANSNGKYERSSYGYMSHDFVPDVTKTFNRGFTSSFLQGDNANMINTRSPKSTGELMGTIVAINAHLKAEKPSRYPNKGSENYHSNSKESIGSKVNKNGYTVDLKVNKDCSLSNGDSFTFFDEMGQLTGFRANKVSTLSSPAHISSSNNNNRKSAPKGSRYTTVEAQGKSQAKITSKSNSPSQSSDKSSNKADNSSTVVLKAGQIVRLHLLAQAPGLAVGAQLHRNVDTIFIKSINMPKALVRKIALKAQVSLVNNVFNITFSDELERAGGISISLSEVLQELKANNADFDTSALSPLKEEVMASKLTKLGDDNLSLKSEDISFDLQDEALIPLSSFNNLRRQALQEYLNIATMPRCQCVANNKLYLDGSTDQYVFKGLSNSPYASLLSVASNEAQSASSVVSAENSNSSQANEQVTNLMSLLGGIDERLIFNERSKAFYLQGMGGKLEPPKPLISKAVMTCRNCLIKNHALCHEDGGSTTGFYLKIGKHTFDVVTNCRRCLMYLVPREDQVQPETKAPFLLVISKLWCSLPYTKRLLLFALRHTYYVIRHALFHRALELVLFTQLTLLYVLELVLWDMLILGEFSGDGAIETLLMGLYSCLFDVVLIGALL